MRTPSAATAAACVAGVIGAAVAGSASAETTQPLQVGNLSPTAAIFGLPRWDGPRGERHSEWGITADIANHYVLAGNGIEELLLDGETWRFGLHYRRHIGEAWSVSLHIPWYRHSGGILDDAVDAWHGITNLPDGNRNLRGENRLQYLYTDRGTHRYVFEGARHGIGDLQIGLSRSFGAQRDWDVKIALKIPTGKQESLTGSGATDIALSVLKRNEVTLAGTPAGLFWGAGVLKPGATDAFSLAGEDWVVFGIIGAGWKPLPRYGFRLQLDTHSGFYVSALDELAGYAVQASIGGWWEAATGTTLTYAFSEDLVVKSSPDFAVHVGLSWRF